MEKEIESKEMAGKAFQARMPTINQSLLAHVDLTGDNQEEGEEDPEVTPLQT